MRYSAQCYSVFIVRHNAQNVKVKIGVKEMNQPLTKSAETVQTALDEIGVICKVLELPSSTKTASDADFVRKTTGFAIGGVPPIGHKNPIHLIYIDQDLMVLDEVWAAAGTPNAVFCVNSKDLPKITKGKVISISNLEHNYDN